MNNFDSRINQNRITRPTQSGWYHVQSEVKGRRTPDGGNHYFSFGVNKSLCTQYIKDPSWKANNDSSWMVELKDHPSICKDCLKLYKINKNRVSSSDEVLRSLLSPHYTHYQVCPKCGLKCIYLSNNKEYVHQDRIHVGCNGHEVPLL